MSTKIRLARFGSKKRPFYRIVVTDTRSPSGRRSLELLGTYDPRTTPVALRLDHAKLNAWIANGATPSDTVARLIKMSAPAAVAAVVVEPPAQADAPA